MRTVPRPTATDAPDGFDGAVWGQIAGVTFDEPWRALAGRVQRSSLGRPWTGLLVFHMTGPGGDLYLPSLHVHSIVVRNASPTDLVQRHGDTWSRTRWHPGDAVVVPAGVPTFWRSFTPRDNIIVHIAPAWLQRLGTPGAQLRSCFGRSDPVLAGIARTLLESLDNNVSLHGGFADAMAQALALHLLENDVQAPATQRASTALSKRQMDRVRDAVLAALQRPWPVAQLAELAGLSPFHFSRAFKAAFGLTPHGWLNLQRMEAAARLVQEGAIPLAEVAQAVGYASAAHFSQAFRRHWGVAPSAWRRQGGG